MSFKHFSRICCVFSLLLSLSSSASAQLSLPGGGTLYEPVEVTLPIIDIPPLTYFDLHDDRDSIFNSYILSYLSDRIYADEIGLSQAWIDQFESDLLAAGAEDVQFFSDPDSGAEVAFVETFHSLIIVYRGSSTDGSNAYWSRTDWVNDLDDDAVERFIGKTKLFVHEGFWRSSGSVFSLVQAAAMDASYRGKSIWLTGHSLGGASAMLAAARLHYSTGITVDGLHTFGAPRVGDAKFVDLLESNNDDGIALADRTRRWVVDGDSAVSLFGGDYYGRWVRGRFGIPKWVVKWSSYHHVGQCNQIYRSGNGPYEWFVDYDSPDLSNDTPFSLASLSDEHMVYHWGMEAEFFQVLTDAGMENLIPKFFTMLK